MAKSFKLQLHNLVDLKLWPANSHLTAIKGLLLQANAQGLAA